MSTELVQVPEELSVAVSSDAHQIFARLKELLPEAEAARKNANELAEQGFLGRFASSITGEHRRSVAKAQDLQGQLQEVQLALAILNLHVARTLYNQQETIGEQQSQLVEANERLEAQQGAIKATTERVSQQQNTILKLLNLSKEQEETIRKIVESAERIEIVEERQQVRFDELGEQLITTQREVSAGLEKQERDVADLATRLHSLLAEEAEKLTQSQEETDRRLVAMLREAQASLSDSFRADLEEFASSEALRRDAVETRLQSAVEACRQDVEALGTATRGATGQLLADIDALKRSQDDDRSRVSEELENVRTQSASHEDGLNALAAKHLNLSKEQEEALTRTVNLAERIEEVERRQQVRSDELGEQLVGTQRDVSKRLEKQEKDVADLATRLRSLLAEEAEKLTQSQEETDRRLAAMLRETQATLSDSFRTELKELASSEASHRGAVEAKLLSAVQACSQDLEAMGFATRDATTQLQVELENRLNSLASQHERLNKYFKWAVGAVAVMFVAMLVVLSVSVA